MAKPMNNIKMIDGDIVKYPCTKCHEFKSREEYADDEQFIVAICGNCYANDYAEDIVEIVNLLIEYQKLGVPLENLKEFVSQKDYEKLMELLKNTKIHN
jgi:NAD-dependent SIR2 family protein deacetylase